LLVSRRRRGGDLHLQNIREQHADGPAADEFHGQPHAGFEEAGLHADQRPGDFGLLEILRIHETTMILVGVQEFQGVLVEQHLFELQFRTKGVLPEGAGVEIAQPGVHGAAHSALAGAVLGGDDLIVLAFKPDHHADAQLRCNHHFRLP
jgi:hypothetical protein